MANIPKFCKIFIHAKDDFLRIPKDFEERYGKDLPIDLCLEVPGGKLWEVELLYSPTFELLITKGWAKFRDDYSITEGYFLVFEYNGDSRFHVLIFDAMGSEIEYRVNTSSTGADHGPNVPPRFHKILLGFELRIPPKFVETYGVDLPDEVFLKLPGGESMKVELTLNKDGEIWLGKGWQEFKDYHSITLGQTLVFQYDSVSREFEVWIFHMTAVEMDYRRVNPETTASESQSFGGDSVDVVGARTNFDKSTCFSLEIKVNNAYTIILPKEFTSANRIGKGMQVILQNAKGKTWNVTVVGKDRRWGKSEQCGLSAGWHDFLVENNVVVGTIMSFRMVSSVNRVIETIVVKNGPRPEELIKYARRKGTMYEIDPSYALRSMKSLTIDSDESVSTESEVKTQTRRSRSKKKSGKKKK